MGWLLYYIIIWFCGTKKVWYIIRTFYIKYYCTIFCLYPLILIFMCLKALLTCGSGWVLDTCMLRWKINFAPPTGTEDHRSERL
jgi:hypothetical protein